MVGSDLVIQPNDSFGYVVRPITLIAAKVHLAALNMPQQLIDLPQ